MLIQAFGGPTRAAIVALAFISISITMRATFWVFPILALAVVVASRWSPVLSQRASLKFLSVTGLLVVASALGRGGLSLFWRANEIRPASAWLSVAGLGVALFAYSSIERRKRASTLAWAAILSWVVISGAVAIRVDPETWIDVWALHADAGTAIGAGESPYVDRAVTNAMPWFPPRSTFEGYVYPPISLATYALSDLVIGDSRWVSVLAGAAIVLVMKKMSSSAETDAVATLMLLVPGWPLIVQLAWTEPLSLLLLAVAFAFGTAGLARPSLVGLLVASKQYLLFWAIPIGVSWLRRRPQALLIAGATALAAYGVGLFFGPSGYVEWVFLFHLTTPTAYVGSNISGLVLMTLGLPLTIPSWVPTGLSIAIGGWFASREPRSDASMVLGGLAMLAVVFLLGSQAFPNYWYFLLGGLTVVILVLQRDPTPSTRSAAESRAINTDSQG